MEQRRSALSKFLLAPHRLRRRPFPSLNLGFLDPPSSYMPDACLSVCLFISFSSRHNSLLDVHVLVLELSQISFLCLWIRCGQNKVDAGCLLHLASHVVDLDLSPFKILPHLKNGSEIIYLVCRTNIIEAVK